MTIEPNLIALGISRQSCEVKRSTTMGRSAAWAVTGDRPANNPSDKTRRENMVIRAGVTNVHFARRRAVLHAATFTFAQISGWVPRAFARHWRRKRNEREARVRSGRTRSGAGEGNRTLVCSLGSCRSAIELRPQSAATIANDAAGSR